MNLQFVRHYVSFGPIKLVRPRCASKKKRKEKKKVNSNAKRED
jgi:hypothetical protein